MTTIRLTSNRGFIRDITFEADLSVGQIIDLFGDADDRLNAPNADASVNDVLSKTPAGKSLLEAVGAPSAAPSPDEAPFDVHPPKGKGGRPPGSKNKPKDPPAAAPKKFGVWLKTSEGIADMTDAQVTAEIVEYDAAVAAGDAKKRDNAAQALGLGGYARSEG